MALDKDHMIKIIKLARLALKESELISLEADLQKIVKFVEQLSEVDISEVEPMLHAQEDGLIMQEDDTPHEVIGLKALLSSRGFEDGLIRVPRIIE